MQPYYQTFAFEPSFVPLVPYAFELLPPLVELEFLYHQFEESNKRTYLIGNMEAYSHQIVFQLNLLQKQMYKFHPYALAMHRQLNHVLIHLKLLISPWDNDCRVLLGIPQYSCPCLPLLLKQRSLYADEVFRIFLKLL